MSRPNPYEITISHAEYQEGHVRRMLTVFFMRRAQRHLRSLAMVQSWSPEHLAAMETRFLQQSRFVPQFVERSHLIDADE
jgi:hypothetical protein